MKRNVFALAVAVVLFTVCSFPVSAGMSPTAETSTILADAAQSDNGTISVLDKEVVSTIMTEVDSIMSGSGTTEEASIKAAFDFVPSEEVAKELVNKGSVEVTFKVDVKAGDNVVILHKGSEWEILNPTSVKNGSVSTVFTSFSPIAIVELPEAVVVEDAITPAGSKTSKGLLAGIIGAVVAVCGVGAVIVIRKKK